MKTLKKTLCIVLVICMAVGMFGVGASAATTGFTDEANIGAAYKEAVDLLTGISVVNGTTATTLEPTGNYTREQAAKIVCYITLGKTTADALVCSADPFDDVKASRWSAGYIQYCVDEGILNGYGDGNFGPADALTGYAWGKMLLCALGYGKADEYIGNSWQIHVAKDALPLGIYKGDTAAATSSNVTRQQAMLMAYNTLFINTATPNYMYDMGVRYVTSYDKTGASYASSVYGYGATSGNTFTAAANATGLAKVVTTVNGAAGYKWFYKNATTAVTGFYSSEKVIGFSAAGTVLTGTNSLTTFSTTNAKYIADIDDTTLGTTLNIYVNGNAVTATAEPGTAGYWYDGTNNKVMYFNGTASAEVRGAGIVYTFIDTDTDTKTAEKLYVTVYTVEKLEAAPVVKNNTVDGKDYIYINMDGANDIGTSAVNTVLASKVTGYADLVKGDIVTVVAKNDGTYDITKAATFNGAATAITGTTVLTIAGTNYTMAAAANSSVTGFTAYRADYTWFTDAYGYLVYGKAVTDATTDYAVVLAADYTAASGLSTAASMKAKLLLTDGTTIIVDVSYVNGEKVDLSTGNTTTITGVEAYLDVTYDDSFFSYVVADDGTYKLTYGAIAATTWAASGTAGATEYNAGTVSMNSKTINSATNVIIATTVAGATKYTVYTGYANIPSINIADAGSRIFSYQTNALGAVIYVYVDATASVSIGDTTSNYAYILDVGYTTDNSTTTPKYTFKAISGGAVATVSTTSTTARDVLDNGQGLYEIVTDNNGLITSVTGAVGITNNALATADLASGGVFNGKAYDGSETVWLVDLAAKTAVTGTITDISVDYDVTVITYATGTPAHMQTIQFIYAEK